jgi:PadR family transcriptional regulator PadR
LFNIYTLNKMKGTYLGEFEELVLLAVGVLNEEAYGFSITEEIEKQTTRVINMRAVHTALYRLEEKGFVESKLGGATKQRGGRRKRLYAITAAGRAAVYEAKEVRNRMWSNLPQSIIEGNI